MVAPVTRDRVLLLLVALAASACAAPAASSATEAPARTPAASAISVATSPTIPTSTPFTPNPGGVFFTSVRSPVARGQQAGVTVSTVPSRVCAITVTYKSGPSTAQGLAPATADGNGRASWSWQVGTNTTPGSWPIDVTCGNASARAFFVVR